MRIVALCLLLVGCGPDDKWSTPFYTILGTTPDGNASVELWEYHFQGSMVLSAREQLAVVDPMGDIVDRPSLYPPAVLAKDCSNQPATLGDCVVATMSDTNGFPSFFLFPDGSSLSISNAQNTSDYQITHTDKNGATWTYPGVVASPVRGDIVLGSLADAFALDLATGTPLWVLTAPASF
jgi:hypothetical protein